MIHLYDLNIYEYSTVEERDKHCIYMKGIGREVFKFDGLIVWYKTSKPRK